MKIKTIAIAAALGCALLQPALSGEVPASTGDVVPGEWNAHFYNVKAYAEAHNVPMILFWANPGCGNCEKMAKAVAKPEFVAWMQESGYVYAFALGTSTRENADAKSFAYNSSKKFPYMSVYYPSDAGWKRYNFSGVARYMPAAGSGLQGRLINSIEMILSSGAGSSGIPQGWNATRNVMLSGMSGGRLAAVATVKLGKAKASAATASVSAKVEILGGKNLRFSGKVAASDRPFSFTKGGYTLTLTATDGGVSGTLTGNGLDVAFEQSLSFGGATSANVFKVYDVPATYGGYPILTQFLPEVVFSTNGTRWSFPVGGTVKWDSASGAFVATSDKNPEAVKLTYKPGTGYFSGKFFMYVQTGAQKVKKLNAKVAGYVVDGVGYGVASVKGLGVMPVQIYAAE